MIEFAESADGTVKIFGLDPAKRYWLIIDYDSPMASRLDGLRGDRDLILLKRPEDEVVIVESPEGLQAVLAHHTKAP